jgi:CDP-glycerol glycerophosphotransferase (TagB/SpsB family)/glycosyltransferase involved in cell wall biosynthesis
VIRKVVKTVPSEWKANIRGLPIDESLIVYESFAGNGVLCNPEALFRAILADPEQAHRRHVWVLKEPKGHGNLLAEFATHPRVRFVRRGSLAYHKALATAGLLINNATFPPSFKKRVGQVYVNTWHGTPMKRMGYDEAEGAQVSSNVLRNFMMADYLLSASPYMSETMYERAYRLENVAPGLLIEEGHPRTDVQFLTQSRASAIERLQELGADVTERDVVVLYAPTWRGESFHEARDDAAGLADVVLALQSRLPATHRVLLKVHQQVVGFARREPRLAGRFVSNDIPANVVLAATDVLVTDYSSIFFDFLSTGRPIVFFTPDLREYASYRGWYIPLEELPGPVVDTVPDLAKVVSAAGTGSSDDPDVSHGSQREAARGRFAPWDDGQATERVLDIVLRGRRDQRRVRPTRSDGRLTLLIYLGGMKSNGITTAALNLLRNLDHDRFDVSVVYNSSMDPERCANFRLIDDRVRQFVRPSGGLNTGKRHFFRKRKLLRGDLFSLGARDREVLAAILLDDWTGMVGTARFDHIIDFSGYSPLWSFMLSLAPAGARSIWLHNDLASDQRREVEGRTPHGRNLAGVFTSYHRFDHLVSVSPALRDINAQKLGRWADSQKFVFARNTIDAGRILEHAEEEPPQGVLEEMDGFRFVTVGRLSPEKNHARLVRAFADVHRDHPNSRLLIVGDGPLMPELQALIHHINLNGAVRLTGLLQNPWSIMSRCQAFVLSSDYEGQPMVILEARVLGLPVITTAFGSVSSALTPEQGLIVERGAIALSQGMRRAIEGSIPVSSFSPSRYNQEVVREFALAIAAHAREK